MVPTLRSIGLYSERIHEHFVEMWSANMDPDTANRIATTPAELPEDLEAWVNEGYESL